MDLNSMLSPLCARQTFVDVSRSSQPCSRKPHRRMKPTDTSQLCTSCGELQETTSPHLCHMPSGLCIRAPDPRSSALSAFASICVLAIALIMLCLRRGWGIISMMGSCSMRYCRATGIKSGAATDSSRRGVKIGFNCCRASWSIPSSRALAKAAAWKLRLIRWASTSKCRAAWESVRCCTIARSAWNWSRNCRPSTETTPWPSLRVCSSAIPIRGGGESLDMARNWWFRADSPSRWRWRWRWRNALWLIRFWIRLLSTGSFLPFQFSFVTVNEHFWYISMACHLDEKAYLRYGSLT